MDILITIQDNVYKTTIDNQELINIYLQNENKDNYIKQLIENGFQLSKCYPLISNCGCCHKIDELSELMEPFNTGGNSSKNGQIGEIFASALFTKRNPHINYIDTAKIEKSGDAIIELNLHSIGKIMVDYKNYDSPIPSDEINKLVRDLHAQNINYGILLSYKSKISKQNYIDFQVIDGKLIVFVASYGLDIFTLEMAIQYIQRLHECNTLSISDKVSELVMKGTMKEFTEIYEAIYDLACQHSQHINSMKENQDKINKMFYGMIGKSQNILTSMNLLLDKSNEIKHTIHRESVTNKHSYTELIDIIDRFVIKEKDKILSKRILNMTNELSIDGYYSDTDGCIHFNSICKLQLSKSKITMIFYNKSDEDCSYNRKYESIKNDNFYIQLSDESKKWEIIQHRFTN